MADFHLLQKSPSLFFWTYFPIIFQDWIFWIWDLISGSLWNQNLHVFRYFSLLFLGFIFGSNFYRFFVDFWPLESLILVLPPAREHNFYKINVFHFIAKRCQKMVVLRVRKQYKIDENPIKKTYLKTNAFLTSIFLDLLLILAPKLVSNGGFF